MDRTRRRSTDRAPSWTPRFRAIHEACAAHLLPHTEGALVVHRNSGAESRAIRFLADRLPWLGADSRLPARRIEVFGSGLILSNKSCFSWSRANRETAIETRHSKKLASKINTAPKRRVGRVPSPEGIERRSSRKNGGLQNVSRTPTCAAKANADSTCARAKKVPEGGRTGPEAASRW